MIRLYAVNINDELNTKEIETLSAYLSSEKQARIKRFYHLKDLKRSLIADILVRWEICRSRKRVNKDIYFDTNEYGKPYLKDSNDFHFNVSHAGDWVVMASNNNPLGVDIEEIKPIEMKIAERFFSKQEYQDLLNQEESRQLDYFFQLWSLKESYIKAEGKGLSIPLDSFSFIIKGEEINITLHKGKSNESYFFQMYNIDPKYKMALCTSDKDAIPKGVKMMSSREIYEIATKIL